MDRNLTTLSDGFGVILTSLSARRAWIEISGINPNQSGKTVALRKESVDRNASYITIVLGYLRRSPQGERG